MDNRPVRLRAFRFGCGRWRREQAPFQLIICQPVRQWPGEAGPPCPADVLAVGPTPMLAAIWRLEWPLARSLSASRILRMGNLCPGMPPLLSKEAKLCASSDHPTVPITPVHRQVAIPGIGGRDQSELLVAINWNRWSHCPGIRILLSHTPEIYRQAAHSDFNLLLSGHTNGGQICLPGGAPIMLDSVLPRRLGCGVWRHHAMYGYTSVGAGTSIVPVRFNCAPEVTLHRLESKI